MDFLDRVLEPLICCWPNLLSGKACCVYNLLFAPIVLPLHAINIYLCTCVSLYTRRLFLKICCCFCRVANCCWMFTDKKFPPNDASLGKIGGDTANKGAGKSHAQVTWLRAGRFSHSGGSQLFGDKVNSRDICQGALGDCWLLAAMACLAEHDGAIHALFRTRERDPRGRYKLRLFDGARGQWQLITIDDHVPCDANAYSNDGRFQPLFTKPRGNELWAMLLEKAFAKFCGSYANLEGGQTIWAVRAMTGDPAREFVREAGKGTWQRLDLVNVKDPNNKRNAKMLICDEHIADDTMFDILLKYNSLRSICCASGASGVGGLHKGHAYSILKVKKVKQFRLVQMRNPWGTGEWSGDWSDKSPLWAQHPDVKKAVGFSDEDDGAFWMSWEDFVRNWERIGVVDRTIDVNTLKLHVADDSVCAPTRGCFWGCLRFWCLCEGARRLYCPHRSSRETVSVGRRCCFLV